MLFDVRRYTVHMKRALCLLLLGVFLAGLGVRSAPAAAECPLRLVFVDVGEGDAILVQPHGMAPVVVDTGSPLGAGALMRYLTKRKLRDLSGVILTHPHLDHVGGVFVLSAIYPGMTLYHTAQPIAARFMMEDMYRWYSELLSDATVSKRILRRGDTLPIGAASIEVLWPPAGNLDDDWNKNSLVLRVSLGAFRALLMGDALKSTEQELLRNKQDLRAAVLKVGHHGSAFATSDQFIAAVAPKLSVISVNAGNLRGYPARETIDRLRRAGDVMRTDIDGDIEVCAWPSGDFQSKRGRGE